MVILGAPAAILRAGCAGRTCPEAAPPPAPAPFCGLPAANRALVDAGYREGRSPDVLASVAQGSVVNDPDSSVARKPWPDLDPGSTRVPIVFVGEDIGARQLPDDTGLDRIAPTLARSIGVDLIPRVRSGRPLPNVGSADTIEVVAIVVWKGVGTRDLEASPNDWPWLARAIERGAATLEGRTGSLPVDPIAGVATIGTGGLPSYHGVTGRLVRDEDGRVVRAMAPGAPIPVIATLAEAWDEKAHQGASIGLIGGDVGDRALIGGDWYVGSDDDDVSLSGVDPVSFVRRFVATNLGPSGGLIGVVLDGPIARMDATTRSIVRALEGGPPATVAVAGTGSLRTQHPVTIADDVAGAVDGSLGTDIVEAVGSGGFFLDTDVASAAGIGVDQVADVMRAMNASDGSSLFADAYAGFSISLARYC